MGDERRTKNTAFKAETVHILMLIRSESSDSLAGPGVVVARAVGGDVELPPESSRVECEGELALVIGRRVRRWRPGGALALEDVVFGCFPADDVTARDLQRGDGQWSRGKSFDTFCPVGRVIRRGLPDAKARITTTVNGEIRQEGRLSEMTFGLARLVEHVSAAMTLEPGDIILTGTPAGVTLLAPGDRVVVAIDGYEPLEHGVRTEIA